MELFFAGISCVFQRVAELAALVCIVVILDSRIPCESCESRMFVAIWVGFAFAIILADEVDITIERLYAWIARYFFVFLVVGTTWFQG